MRIIAIDLASITRKFFELDKDGKLSDGSALSASLQYLARACDGFDRVVVARDVRPSFRKGICPTYKAGREDPGPVYEKLEKDVAMRLFNDGATVFPSREEKALPEFTIGSGHPEADDVLASLAGWYTSNRVDGWSLTIASEDSDLAALVCDDYAIEMRRFDGSIWHEAEVIEKIGCQPEMVRHVKALGGDSADGYKPFPHHDPPIEGARTKPGLGTDKAIGLLANWRDYGDPALGLLLGQRVLLAAQDGAAFDADSDKQNPANKGMRDCHERRCLLAGGAQALAMGYGCATMLDSLPLGFARILEKPIKRSIVAPKKAPEASAPLAVPAPAEPSPSPAPMVLREAAAIDRPRRDKNQIERYAMQPRSFDEVCQVGEMLYDARMFPQFSTWQGISGAIMVAAEQGIGAGQALRGTYVVEGKLSFSAALIASLVRKSPSCKALRLIPEECDATKATVEFQRDDMVRPSRYVFTIAMATTMKGGKLSGKDTSRKTKWETQPHLMLCWAALREVCRLYWFDIASGMYTPDEVRTGQDIEDAEFEQTRDDFAVAAQ
jgi:5'-3' exonuclease